jgi:hypothetical protein
MLKLIFQAVAAANIADNAATSPLTNLWVGLHTADPGAGGSQTTSEAAYTGYARQSVARSTSGWSISGETITPVANITFPAATAGSETEAFFSIGTSQTGAGEILYSGAISPTIVVASGVTPVITNASTVVEA